MIQERETIRRTRTALALVVSCVCGFGCGREVEYYASGVRRAEGRTAFQREGHDVARHERETGPWTWWYPNGERREQGTLEHGAKVGLWTQWYPNGQIRARGERAFDAATHSSPREGLWTLWHENGERLGRGIYRHGKREGHWDYMLEDGAIDSLRTGEYHDDELLDCAGEVEER